MEMVGIGQFYLRADLLVDLSVATAPLMAAAVPTFMNTGVWMVAVHGLALGALRIFLSGYDLLDIFITFRFSFTGCSGIWSLCLLFSCRAY